MSIAEQLSAVTGSPDFLTEREMFRSGLTLAEVTNISDDENLNRVQCRPISKEVSRAETTDWCYVMAPMGGKNSGAFFFPQVGDLVVLAYVDGDPHRPLVLGAFWNTVIKPPRTVKEGNAGEYVLRTPKGIEILLRDKDDNQDDKQKVSVTMPSGAALTLDDEKSKVTVQDKQGDNALVMDLKEGEISLKAKSKISIEVGKAKIQLKSDGSITLEGSDKVIIKGTAIQVKGSSKISMQSASSEIKADAELKLNSSGIASLKGAIVKIN